VHVFRLSHAFHIGQQFNESSGISNTHSNLEFGIPLLRRLICFSDADFVGCGIDQKNTSDTCHFLESYLICWSTHKQSSIAQSTTGSEYVATASCCSEILWIVHTMRDYRVTYKSVPFMCDNLSAMCLAHNPIFLGRAKHIKVRHHFLRNHVEKKDIVMKYIDTARQLIDIFTKPP
jgi:hypothetical protein